MILTKGRGGAFSDSQVAACAQATLQKPHRGMRSCNSQTAVERRPKKDSNAIKKSAALGYRRSKSMTNLNSFNSGNSPFTGQMYPKNKDMTASCSALDLPLPSQPRRMSALFEDRQREKPGDYLRVNENVAYTTVPDIDSRPPMPPPYTESDKQSHFYEQLDHVQITVL